MPGMFGKGVDHGKIAQRLTVDADLVLTQQFDPGQYPHRHLAVQKTVAFGPPTPLIPSVMAAVETLGRMGWELVSFVVADKTLCAVMRRD
jgi:hypothetical protein